MSRRNLWAALCLSAGLISSAQAVDNTVFGGLKGNLAVSAGGVASYAIPIELPRSRGSFSPSLEIKYSSQVDNGELGVGFVISGTSTINRCAQTYAQDGKAGRISYDEAGDSGTASGITDRFCLDGMRLVLVSGQYGYNESEYRTEIDSKRRIRFYRQDADHSYFTIEGADGITAKYGDVSNSLFKTTERTIPRISSWLLQKVQDRHGNYYEYQYVGVATLPGAAQLLDKISYGANAPAAKGASHEIKFVYESKNDKTIKYANDIKYVNDRLLKRVDIQYLPTSSIVSKYLLAYEQGSASKRSRITSIKQCNAKQQTANFDCKEPVSFTWTDRQATDPVWTESSDNFKSLPVDLFEDIGGEKRPNYIKFVDLDGDGDKDIIWSIMWGDKSSAFLGPSASNGWTEYSRGAYLNTDQGWVSAPNYKLPFDSSSSGSPVTSTKEPNGFRDVETRFVDLNGDGLVDIVSNFTLIDYYLYNSNQVFQARAYSAAWVQVVGTSGESSKWQRSDAYATPMPLYEGTAVGGTAAEFADVNGDGLPDFIYSVAGLINNGSNFTPYNANKVYINTPGASTGTATRWVEDTTYALPQPLYKNTNGSMYFGNAGATVPANPGPTSNKFIDLNGDGLPDYIYYRANSGTVEKGAYINNQYAAAGVNKWLAVPSYNSPVAMHKDPQTATMTAYIGGMTFALGTVTYLGDLGVRYVDLNGDGLVDQISSRLARYNNDGNALAQEAVVNSAYLNTGTGWASAPQYVLPNAPAGANIPGPKLLYADTLGDLGGYFVDVNGDNLVDFISNWTQRDANNAVVAVDADAYINTGDGWERKTDYIPPASLFSTQYKYWGSLVEDTNADGVIDLLYYRPDLPAVGRKTYLSQVRGDALKQVTDGYGAITKLTFRPISSSNTYQPGTPGSVSSSAAVGQPVMVLAQLERSAGTAGGELVKTTYTYSGLKTNLQGRGSAGFESVKEITEYPSTSDSLEAAKRYETVETKYAQAFPFFGQALQQIKSSRKEGGADVTYFKSETSSCSGAGCVPASCTGLCYRSPSTGVYIPYVKAVTESSSDASAGTLLSTKLITEDVDSYGNVITHNEAVTESVGGATYANNTSNVFLAADLPTWQISRLDTKTTLQQRSGVAQTITRKAKQTYYANGLLKDVIEEPDTNLFKSTKTFTYDGYGNISSHTLSGSGDNALIARSGISSRTETLLYGAGTGYDEGVYLTTRTKPVTNYVNGSTNGTVNHVYGYTYDPLTGAVLVETDPNGVQSIHEIDSFGLETTLKRKAGATERTIYSIVRAFCVSDCQPGEKYKAVASLVGAADVITYHDELGRERRRVTKAYSQTQPSSGYLSSATVYDTRGLKICESRAMNGAVPTACANLSAANKWTQFDYDGLRREIKKKEPVGVTETTYEGLLARVKNAKQQQRTVLQNALGEQAVITDALSKTLTFTRDAAGRVVETKDAANNLTTYVYDVIGRKTSMTDPDMGTWTYDYNVAGELIRQKNSSNLLANLYYDELGRLYRRENTDLVSNWQFDTAANGIGKQAKATADNGYQETNVYDAWGRLSSVTTRIDSVDYAITTDYDSADRVLALTYPTGFKYENVYDADGYLSKVQDATAGVAPHPVFWEAVSRDEDGHVTKERLGNQLATARTYNPSSGRIDTILTGSESAGVIQPGIQNDSYLFDALGNLSMRNQYVSGSSFAESFEYDDLNRVTKTFNQAGQAKLFDYDAIGNIANRSDIGAYSYQGCNGVHRVCSISGRGSFTYDLRGNLLTGEGRTYTWTSFNMPASIARDSSNTEAFLYGDDFQRTRRDSKVNGQTTTILYVNPRIDTGATYEKAIKPDTSVEHTHYIYANGVAIGAAVKPGSSAMSYRYFHADHIGSTTTVSDAAGLALERFSYDAWGARRGLDALDDVVVTPISNLAGLTLPTSTVDRYTLLQSTAGKLVVHTTNRLKTSPMAVGAVIPVAQTVRLVGEVKTSPANVRHRSFVLGFENTAPAGANYRRFSAYLLKDQWMVQACTGAVCSDTLIGPALSDTEYVVEVTSAPATAFARVFKKNDPNTGEAHLLLPFDMSAASQASQKRVSTGVSLRGYLLPLAGTILPIKRPDAATTLQTLAWEQVSPDPQEYTATSTRHGFTLHEQLDNLDLVHMNGRVYDPQVGRFVSADPNVFYPENLQDYNRYSYVWNNPLSFTDPDGFECVGCGPLGGFLGAGTMEQLPDLQTSRGVALYNAGKFSPWWVQKIAPIDDISGALKQIWNDKIAVQDDVDQGDARFVKMSMLPEPRKIPISKLEERGANWIKSHPLAADFGGAVLQSIMMGVGRGNPIKGAGPASSLANAQRLRAQLIGDEIAGGHAFEKHVIQQGEFMGLGIRTREQFSEHIASVVNKPSGTRYYSDGRIVYFQESSSTVVIRNGVSGEGTAFQPKNWADYIKRLPTRDTPY